MSGGREPSLPRDVAMRLAATEYDRFVEAIAELEPAEWQRPTCCPGWDVRAMVAHVVGMAELAASPLEQMRQMRAAKRRHTGPGPLVDSLTAVQVDKHGGREPDELVRLARDVAPRAARGRRRTPSFVRRRAMAEPQPVNGVAESWTLGYLVDVILTRDTWTHRGDIAAATGRPLRLTADHDGVIVADLVREWQERHGQPCTLTLTGPAGGSWTFGTGGPAVTLDAVEFCRTISGRPAPGATRPDGALDLLAVEVPV